MLTYLIKSLAVANKAMFRNCLVAMHSTATKADIPLIHDILIYIYNCFVEFLSQIGSEIQVRSFNAKTIILG